MLPFHQVVADDFEAVNQRIIEQLHSDVELVENIGHYLIEAGGKRLRPLMVLLTCRALDYRGQDNLDLAAIIEFIHTATLLHDDVVDTSERRRGRITANAQWGNAPAVLVGDFLYSRAFQMMVAIGSMDIMSVLSETTNRIAEGEVQQLVNAKDPAVTESNYFSVIDKKTAILFASACEVAAVLSEAAPDQRQALRAYGHHVGMAFQLVDDALDYQGDAEALGKNVGDDLAEGKPTLPLIYAMQTGTPDQKALVAGAIRAGDTTKLPEILRIVEETGAMEYTLERARAQVASARAQLAALPENAYTRAMAEVAEFALARTH
ncbi:MULTISPECIES: polyprenyl synthetase family protein [Marinimicrobium]|jgi:octaprenyl-diphosphate synthase|uniref:Octaprenyl diphosphate synthase n=1 Tax=Marinimicrobium koreense TaxID=306545 RepID=A0A3N1NLW1_9GAMM|nr:MULTISPECIES: polyprenyl synthetase family protein [Marinimicrobium]MAN51477.1 octaprenyl diphosphate synthase [Marinimicrobium sp.]ROQ17093.1 octaprenyl-diphosphate synthase [Marinimicrobium koreense]|tara:strand:- start:138 stop:1100 length:963 start_codon:yes stop_codon:yes gene_type:complete